MMNLCNITDQLYSLNELHILSFVFMAELKFSAGNYYGEILILSVTWRF